MKSILKKIIYAISSFLTFIGIAAVCWAVPAFLFSPPSPDWIRLFISIMIAVFCFGQYYLVNKIKKSSLSPEEVQIQEKEEKELKNTVERAKYQNYISNYRLIPKTETDKFSFLHNVDNPISKLAYEELEKMLSAAEDVADKNKILISMVKMLKEDKKMLLEDIETLKSKGKF